MNKEEITNIIIDILDEENQDHLNIAKSNIKEQYSVKTYSELLLYIDLSLKSINRIIIRGNSEITNIIPDSIKYYIKTPASDSNTNYLNNPMIVVPHIIDLEKDKDIKQTIYQLKEILNLKAKHIIKQHAPNKSFDCCSHYMECSDAKNALNMK